MAAPSPTPSFTQYLSSTDPLQPNAGSGPRVRFGFVNATGSSFSVTTTNFSASAMSGLIFASILASGTVSNYITGTTSSSNGDGTLGVATGPWVFTGNNTNPSDFVLMTISRA